MVACAGGAASLHALRSASLRALAVENEPGDPAAAGGLAVSGLAGPLTARDVTLTRASSAAAPASFGALAGTTLAAKLPAFPRGGAVSVVAAASLAVRDSRFAGNGAGAAGASGGALHASDVAGEVRLEGCAFEGDAAAGDGGSVALEAVASVLLRSVSVAGSRALGGNGGCLSVAGLGGPLVAEDLELAACNATGTPDAGGGAGGCLALLGAHRNASAAFRAARFSGCAAAASAEWAGLAGGGAALLAELGAAAFEGCEFVGNADRGQALKEMPAPRTEGGGALLAASLDRLLVAGSRFEGNSALVKGGAVAAVQVADAALRLCAFERNAADNDNGGAPFPSLGGGGAVSYEGKEGPGWTLRVENSSFAGNVEVQSGGGQMRGGGAVWAEKASLVAVRGSSFAANAGQRGGALSVGAQALVVEECSFAGNGWPADDEAGRTTEGGAIDARLSGPATSLVARTSFTKNSGAKGGAARLATDGAVAAPARMESVSFVGNAAGASGGALVVSQLDLAASGVTFRGNSAGQAAGALLVDAERRCTIRFAGASFTRNEAQDGGAVALVTSVADVRLEITSASFALNEAKNNGGALLKENGELLVRACAFESNRALSAGGALYLTDNVGWARLENSSLTANTATENGGALAAVLRAAPALVGCLLRRNVAQANGGALWCMKSSACSLTASSVESGSADRGGAVFVDQDANLALEGVSLSRNVAEAGGGAILAGTRARLAIRGGAVSGNQAARGGGILLEGEAAAVLNGTAVTVNLAASRGKEARPDGTGGGIAAASNSSCTLLPGTLVTSNRADAGAGVAVLNTARFTAGVEEAGGGRRRALLQSANGTGASPAVGGEVVLIGFNVATGNGAGLLQTGGTVRLLRGVQLAENTAGGRGGGFFYEAGTLALAGAQISKNQATDGAGAYVRPASCEAISIRAVAVQNNVATGGGGAFFVDAKDPAACAPFASLAAGPSEYFTSLEGNRGRFGGGIAAVPRRVVLFGPRNATPPHNETTPASRMPLYYKVELRDSFNQIVRTATGAVVAVTATGNASVAGTAQMATVEGVAEFKDLQVIAQPGVTAEIVFTATFPDGSLLTASTTLPLRHCMRGEVLEENKAYCPTCSYCRLCPPGTYSLEDRDFRGKECRPCPAGANCLFGGSDVRPQRGYWQSPYDPHKFIECVNKACLSDYAEGVLNATRAADLVAANLTNAQFFALARPCAFGYEGNLCAVCVEGYGRRSDYDCQTCPEPTLSRLIAVLVVLFLILVASFMIRKHIKSFSKSIKEERGGILVKIFTDYLQIVSMAKGFQIRWPGVVKDMLDVQTSVASPLDSMLSLDCMFDLNTSAFSRVIRPFYARVVGFVSIPLLCVLLPAAILVAQPAWHRLQCWRRGRAPSEAETAKAHSHARDNYYVSVVVTLYLIHPQITQKMFKLFSCRDLGGGASFLQQDMKVDCNTLEFKVWQWGLGAPAIVVYGFGIPLGTFFILFRNRNRLNDPAIKRKFSFLYRGYEQRCWYWEIVVIIRKLLIALVVSVLDGRPQIQGLIGLGILLAAMVLNLKLAPWDSDLLDVVDLCAIVVSTTTVYAGLFFYNRDFLDRVDEDVITYTLIVLNVLFIALFLFVYFREWAVKIVASLAARHPGVARWRDDLLARFEEVKRRYEIVEKLDELLSGANDGRDAILTHRSGKTDLDRFAAREAALARRRSADEKEAALGLAGRSRRGSSASWLGPVSPAETDFTSADGSAHGPALLHVGPAPASSDRPDGDGEGEGAGEGSESEESGGTRRPIHSALDPPLSSLSSASAEEAASAAPVDFADQAFARVAPLWAMGEAGPAPAPREASGSPGSCRPSSSPRRASRRSAGLGRGGGGRPAAARGGEAPAGAARQRRRPVATAAVRARSELAAGGAGTPEPGTDRGGGSGKRAPLEAGPWAAISAPERQEAAGTPPAPSPRPAHAPLPGAISGGPA
eukprot:tig00000718_g3694.t1